MKRDIKYILKRVLIGVLISIILFNLKSCNVHAMELNGSYYFSPPNVGFYANTSPSNHQYMGGTFNASYGSYSSTAIQNLGGSNDLYGADLCIEMDTALQKDYLYSASLILSNANNYSYGIASGDNYTMMRGGYIISTAINNANSIKLNYFMVTNTTNITGSLSNNGRILNYLFIPYANYNVVCFPFKTGAVSNVIHNFLGYHIEVIGNTAGLSSSQVSDSVNAGIDRLYSALGTDLGTIESEINTNINDTRTAIINEEKKTTKAVEDVNDTLNDDSTDDPDSKLNQVSGKVATNNVISDLVLLPVTLFTKVLDSLNSTCTSYNLGSLYNHNIVFPCINVADYIGSALWSVIDVLISGLLIYAISRKFIKVFNELSSLKEGDIID